MPAARWALCDRARLDTLRSTTPRMAVEDPFRHADARREARAVADPLRRRKRRFDNCGRWPAIAARADDRDRRTQAGRGVLHRFPGAGREWTAARRRGAGA